MQNHTRYKRFIEPVREYVEANPGAYTIDILEQFWPDPAGGKRPMINELASWLFYVAKINSVRVGKSPRDVPRGMGSRWYPRED